MKIELLMKVLLVTLISMFLLLLNASGKVTVPQLTACIASGLAGYFLITRICKAAGLQRRKQG